MVPIAWMLARRVRTAQRERERLMQRAIESSDRERRRIAGDLHDGPVQELAGLSMRLSASAEQADDEAAASVATRFGVGGARQRAHAALGDRRRLPAEPATGRPRRVVVRPGRPALSAHGIDATVEIDPVADVRARGRRVALPCLPGGGAQRRGARRRARRRAGVGAARGRARRCSRSPTTAAASTRARWSTRGRKGTWACRSSTTSSPTPEARSHVRPADPAVPSCAWRCRPVIRVAIADDHKVVRVGLEQLLQTFDDVEFLGSRSGGEEAVDPLRRAPARRAAARPLDARPRRHRGHAAAPRRLARDEGRGVHVVLRP